MQGKGTYPSEVRGGRGWRGDGLQEVKAAPIAGPPAGAEHRRASGRMP